MWIQHKKVRAKTQDYQLQSNTEAELAGKVLTTLVNNGNIKIGDSFLLGGKSEYTEDGYLNTIISISKSLDNP